MNSIIQRDHDDIEDDNHTTSGILHKSLSSASIKPSRKKKNKSFIKPNKLSLSFADKDRKTPKRSRSFVDYFFKSSNNDDDPNLTNLR